jgi:acetamidase/formamidase
MMAPAMAQATYHLKASAKTVVVGYYSAMTPPALRVKSGDIVEIETLGVNSPAQLRRVGMRDDQDAAYTA